MLIIDSVKYYSTKEVSEITNAAEATVENYAKKGVLKARLLLNRKHFSEESIAAFLTQWLTVGAPLFPQISVCGNRKRKYKRKTKKAAEAKQAKPLNASGSEEA